MGVLAFLYGVLVYVFFLATFVYAIGFVGNLPLLPKTIDSGAPVPLAEALIVNLLLLGAFAVQHSVMARRGFKRWWTRFVPEPMERSTFVLAATAVLALLLWLWRPIAEPVIWNVEHPAGRVALHLMFWLGWAVLLISTFLINHFELFGLRQVLAQLLRREIPAPEFRTPLFYRHVRHPIYLGFVIAFWSTPQMSAGHLLFAIATTGYILVGIWFEERDLIAQFGARYHAYRGQVGMLIPRLRKGGRHGHVGD
ncbi:MAG: isoprenylcysteine carboxylmethyltransferase family protein [Burkholderiaceae bacterium]|nr:isoprenylcysteine carboxylmethyltransferase family protein [Burkholderiaceae bacterium]